MRTKSKNRIRKSTKYLYTAISIVLLITSFISLMENLSKENIKTRTKEIYNYTNKFKYDYEVDLIQNKYMKETQVTDKTLAYVTDLIDVINMDLDYEYKASKKTNLKYKYSIIGKMQVVYTKDGEEQKIWEEKEYLVEEKQLESDSDKFTINEKLKLDLKQKNQLLNQFKQQMGMSIDAKYTIILVVNTITNVEEKEIKSDYNTEIQIDLAEKTSKIVGENNKEDTKYISKEYQVNGTSNIIVIIIDIILIAISIVLMRYVLKSKATNRVRNEFRIELNRILKICQDKIVQVSSKPIDRPEEIVFVKDFGEIVKVSEELFKPILYYFDSQNEEAWFSVMTGTIVYRYILRK